MSTLTHTCTRGYTNVPPIETAQGAKLRPNARYAFATRPGGVGVGVEVGFRTLPEARRARENARRRGEWVSPLLERVGAHDWLPANPRLRSMYVAPTASAA